jgi:hypothetical protein
VIALGETAAVVLWFGSWFVAIGHLLRHTEAQFVAALGSKTAWTVALVVLGPFAAAPYWLTIRKRLDRLVATAP